MQKQTLNETKEKFILSDIVYLLLSIYIFFGYLFPDSISYVILTISFFSLFIHSLANDNEKTFEESIIILLVSSFIITNLISTLFSDFYDISLKVTIFRFVIFATGIGLLYLQKHSGKFIKYMMIFSFIHTASTLFSYFFPDYFLNRMLVYFPTQVKAASLYFYLRNVYSGITIQTGYNVFLIAIGFIIVFSQLTSRKSRNVPIAMGTLIVLFTAILLTGKRGTLLAIAMSGLMLFIIDAFFRGTTIAKKIFRFGFAIIIILVSLILIIPETAAPFVRTIKTLELDGDITSNRMYLYSRALEMFYSRPLIGNGNGVFAIVHDTGVHNMYFQLLADNGLIGFISFLAILVVNIRTVIKYIRIPKIIYNPDLLKCLYFSLMFQLYYIFYGLTANPLNDGFVLVTYIIAATIPYTLRQSNQLKNMTH